MDELLNSIKLVPSQEQQTILNTFKSGDELIIIDSVAGSAKSTTLKMIANDNPNRTFKYIVFSKMQQKEAIEAMPSNVDPRTIHSLAYEIVRAFVGTIEIKSNRQIIYLSKVYSKKTDTDILIDLLDRYCASSIQKVEDFVDTFENLANKSNYSNALKKIMYFMLDNKAFSHNGYLKWASLLVQSNQVNYEVDVLAIDEANDAIGSTAILFENVKAKQKIVVGDKNQEIFGFMHTESMFKFYSDVGTHLKLTKSYRCNEAIATVVQDFGKDFFDDDFVFVGTKHEDTSIDTTLILTRTNNELANYVLSMTSEGKKFNLTRNLDAVFQDYISFRGIGAKANKLIGDMSYLNEDIKEYHNSQLLKMDYKSCYDYLDEVYEKSEEYAIFKKQAFSRKIEDFVILKDIASEAFKTKEKHRYVLSTAHSSKGLTADKVILDSKLISWFYDNSNNPEAMRLAYVAATRAKHEVDLNFMIKLIRDKKC